MDKIKIGQIGVGHAHAAGKMAAYRANPDFEVVGVVEADPQLRTQAQSSPVYRDLKWMTQEQLLDSPGLAAVAIETQVRHLLDTAEACIAAGKHIHLDKPAGSSLVQFQRILDQAASKHLLVQMGYMYRYSPAVLLLREFVQRGWLGEVFEVHTVMSKVIDPAGRRRLAEYHGGLMFELGCHVLDLVVGLLGPPASVTPYRQQLGAGDALADNMLAVCTYPRALATIKSSGLEVEGGARRHLVVCGTEGTFHIQPLDAPRARIALSRGRPGIGSERGYRAGYQEIEFSPFERYIADAADMAAIVRGEREPAFSYDHDYAVQKALLEACQMPLE
jgi:predicted dehydrogenase